MLSKKERVGSDEMTDQQCSCCVHHVLSLGFEFNCFPYRFEEREWFITMLFRNVAQINRFLEYNVRKNSKPCPARLMINEAFLCVSIDFICF